MHADAELFFKLLGDGGAEFFGADQDVADFGELLLGALACVGGGEGGCGEQERGAVLFAEFADGFGVAGVGMKDHGKTVDEREPEVVAETEAMEEGQNAEHDISGADGVDLADGVHVR